MCHYFFLVFLCVFGLSIIMFLKKLNPRFKKPIACKSKRKALEKDARRLEETIPLYCVFSSDNLINTLGNNTKLSYTVSVNLYFT